MKHHLRLKKAIAFVVALTMTVTVLASCEDKDDSSSSSQPETTAATSAAPDTSEAPDSTGDQPQEENEPSVIASSVKFASSGRYTTTVKANKQDADLSGLTKDNVEVTYIGLEEGTVLASPEEGEETPSEDEYTYSDGERIASLEDIKQNADGSYEITFTDADALRYGVAEYNIRLKSTNESIPVEVEFDEPAVTPDIKEVAPSATEVKVTLTLDGSEYADNVTAEMISLDNAFYGMNVESVSASGKNLTVLLKGNIIANDSRGAYLFGTVIVAPEAVKDCACELRANVTLLDSYVDFKASTLKFDSGKATIDLVAYDKVDLDSLTKDNFKIEGVTVENVEKKDNTTASVTLSVKDAKTGSDVARALEGKEADIGGVKVPLTIAPTSFYPVFDYCETEGDDFRMKIILYAYRGTFNSDMSTDAFSFGSGFEKAKAESVTVDEGGTNAELEITVAADGQKDDSFFYNGDITIAEGAMTTAWGEKTDKAVTYNRDYSQDSLGKFDTSWLKSKLMWDDDMTGMKLTQKDLQAIQDWVKGKNTWYGSAMWAFGIGSSVLGAISGFITFLEFVGLKDSDMDKIMAEFKEVKEMIREIDIKLEKVRSKLNDIERELYLNSLEPFDSLRSEFITATESVTNAMAHGVEDLKSMNITLPDNATVKQIRAYNDQLLTYIYKRSGENNGQNRFYSNFNQNYEKMVDCINKLYNVWLNPYSMRNPFASYDKLYSTMYNFDTLSFGPRALIRETVRASLLDALPVMALRNNITSDVSELPDNDPYKIAYTRIEEMCRFIDENEVTGIATDEIVFEDGEVEVEQKYGETFISDLIIVGWGKRSESTNMIRKLGYELVDYDLNAGAGGKYIYLGYKTTTDYKEAIKNIVIRTGKDNKQDTWDNNGVKYQLCPYDNGDGTFKGEKGTLNCDAGGTWMRLYYTKEDIDGTAISGILVNQISTNAVSGKDLNEGAGGSDIFLHTFKSYGSGPIYIKDPQVTGCSNAAYDENGIFRPYGTEHGEYEGLDVDLCPSEEDEKIYLCYQRTDKYEEAVKDFILIPGERKETIVKGSATYKPVPHYSDQVNFGKASTKFTQSNGNLNYANGGTELHLYYTTDEVPEKGGVMNIYADSNGDYSVSSKSVNMGAPNAPVTYLHLEKVHPDTKRTVRLVAGDNPAYHPYCYVLGGTVRLFRAESEKELRVKAYNNRALGFRVWRNWTNDEVTDFLKKMGNRTFGKEMELAGMDVDRNIYTQLSITIMKSSLEKELNQFRTVTGNCFYPTSKTLQTNYVSVQATNPWQPKIDTNGTEVKPEKKTFTKNEKWGLLLLD